jgi:hypothetical protein
MARALGGVCLTLLLLPAGLHADGGAVRFAGRVGAYRVTVFTAPTPLRAGPVDVSVLVLDADTGEPAPEVPVRVRLTPAGPEGAPIEQEATPQAATNKLFRSALVDLPAAGAWRLNVAVGGAAAARVELEAAKRLPRWWEMLPWIAWPAAPVVLYALHQVLGRPGRVGPHARPPSPLSAPSG